MFKRTCPNSSVTSPLILIDLHSDCLGTDKMESLAHHTCWWTGSDNDIVSLQKWQKLFT